MIVSWVYYLSRTCISGCLNRQQKRATCFAKFLQNELSSYVARFTTHSDLPCNKSGCCRKKRVVLPFATKICTCCAFYRPKANLFCSKWRKSGCMIMHNACTGLVRHICNCTVSLYNLVYQTKLDEKENTNLPESAASKLNNCCVQKLLLGSWTSLSHLIRPTSLRKIWQE